MVAGFPKNPVWIYAILGNFVCVLVPCVWCLGLKNSQHTLPMSTFSVEWVTVAGSFRYCIPVYIHHTIYSGCFFRGLFCWRCICLTQEKMVNLNHVQHWVVVDPYLSDCLRLRTETDKTRPSKPSIILENDLRASLMPADLSSLELFF